MATPVSIYSSRMEQKDSLTEKLMKIWYQCALAGGSIAGQGNSGGDGAHRTPHPQNLTQNSSVTAPVGAAEFSIILKTGTGTITVGAQSAFNLTVGAPLSFAAPLAAAIVVATGSTSTADVSWSV